MKNFRITSTVLLFITSIIALFAGFAFITDSSGSSLNISTDILLHSPFSDFLIPGIILFAAIGLFSLLAGLAIIMRLRIMSYVVIIQGAVISSWIITQIIFLHSLNIFHFLFIVIGILLIFFGIKMNLLRNIIMLDPSEQFDN